MKKITLIVVGFFLISFLTKSVLAVEKNYRAVIVDKNLNIMKIINYTKDDVQPRIFLENEFGIELPYTESIQRHFESMKSSLNFSKKGLVYDANRGTILNLFSRLFYVIIRSLGGH